MSTLMDSVNQRTRLAGTNRMELLIFKLKSGQPYGLNVFKIKEILSSLKIRTVPQSSGLVRGIAHIRGQTITVLDLQAAIEGVPTEDIENTPIVVTEYNRTSQAFYVNAVDKIINVDWEAVIPPPAGLGSDHYLTGVTEFDGQTIQLVDVEKVLYEACPVECDVRQDLKQEVQGEIEAHKSHDKNIEIVVCDDSSVARNQVKRTIQHVGENINIVTFKNGRETLDFFKQHAADGDNYAKNKDIILISDIEMPEMDGYKLTTELRSMPDYEDLYIILHSSLSGVFNDALIEQVGANRFIPKFDPNDIAVAISEKFTGVNNGETAN